MQQLQNGQLKWLEFNLLSDIPKLKHAVFLRHGGVSEGPYCSLNTAFNKDNEAHVKHNLSIIEAQLKQEVPEWKKSISGWGSHGKNIEYVDADSSPVIMDCDGLICKTAGISLMMKHADCQIALIYDPMQHIVSNIHCGWRGSTLNIYAEAINMLKNRFGSNPANLLVCISPSLGPDEAEFINYRHELPEEFWPFQVRPTYFDFWSISEHQLQAAGILPHHIEIARLSTYSNSHDFFSHRRDKITGRHATCITLL